MQQTAAMLYQAQSLRVVETQIVAVKEVFRLQNTDELHDAELRYLPVNGFHQSY